MNSIKIKVCGITTSADACAVAACGVDYLGYVIHCFWSARNNVSAHVSDMVAAVRSAYPHVKHVGVFAGEPIASLREIQEQCGFDVLQLYDVETAEYCMEIHGLAEIWKAVVIQNTRDISEAIAYRGRVDKIVFDAGKGSGTSINLRLLESVEVDVLAGGLNPNNVKQAIDRVRPKVVDVSSGVESTSGRKDISKVIDFVSAVHI